MKKFQYLITLFIFILLFTVGCSLEEVEVVTVAPVAWTPTNTPTIPPTLAEIPIPQEKSLPNPEGYTWELFLDNLEQPLYLTHAGDDSGRVFIVEKEGRILIAQNGELFPQPFIDIRGRVGSRESERGLLGMAFHPNYPKNGYFYLNYTDLEGDTVISRFEVSPDPNLANAESESVLLQINQPYANHNGGMLAFGPDGYLYIGTGDGGSGGDPQGNAQNTNTLLGKILRLDVDAGVPYAIPGGNNSHGLPEIWADGLRNPWRFSFDHVTGDLFIGDVGQNQWEEIHFLPAEMAGGSNLGWDYYEGTHTYEGTPPEGVSFISPILEYGHSGRNCSVTGGYVYRGQALAEWQGVYLFGDYCSGIIWAAIQDSSSTWQVKQVFDMPVRLASFGEDQNGELYLIDLNGAVYTLTTQ